MEITLNKTQFDALNRLRGMPTDVFYLVMRSRPTPTGGVVEGTSDDFAQLVEFISGELAEGLVWQRDVRPLIGICEKIDPDCLDWLGM